MNIQAEKDRIQGFVDRANYHAAINLAISAMNECRREKQQAGVDEFLAVIKHIAQVMDDEFGSKSAQQ